MTAVDLGGTNAVDRKFRIIGKPFDLPSRSQGLIDGAHSGKLITDLDLSQTLDPYILKYYFYPAVDLFTPVDFPDYLVVYGKGSSGQLIPANYRILPLPGEAGIVAARVSMNNVKK